MSSSNTLHRRLQLHDQIPVAKWSDARRAYYIEGKTLAQISLEQFLDTRTIRRLILYNLSFNDCGKHTAPKQTSNYEDIIVRSLCTGLFAKHSAIMGVSTKIFEYLKTIGYEGGERSVREYIKSLPWQIMIREAAEKPVEASEDG